ncbi:unnamed protein product [Musa hybrid cultivar]
MALFRRDRSGSIRKHGLRGRTFTSLEKQEVRSLTHDIDDTLDRDFKKYFCSVLFEKDNQANS